MVGRKGVERRENMRHLWMCIKGRKREDKKRGERGQERGETEKNGERREERFLTEHIKCAKSLVTTRSHPHFAFLLSKFSFRRHFLPYSRAISGLLQKTLTDANTNNAHR